MSDPARTDPRVADAAASNWFDRLAPAAVRPYGQLARFDRPIGAWLLLFPCWWSQMLAEVAQGRTYPNVGYLLLFLIGAFVMRGAGCTHNDIVDREYDKRVARTASRPIPSGRVSVLEAFVFAIGLCVIGFLVLIQFNWTTVAVGIASLVLVAIYPFAKRYTHWAQLLLGLTFKWGALVGWTAVTGSLGWPAIVLYVGAVLWTIGYDTIYAHQDREDDAVLGLKSTAILFGDQTPWWVGGFYAGAWLAWFTAAMMVGASVVLVVALAGIAGQMAWQVATLDIAKPDNCLTRFRSNSWVGWLFCVGLVAEMVIVNVGRMP